jgi:lysophospholipase L1-like esterase
MPYFSCLKTEWMIFRRINTLTLLLLFTLTCTFCKAQPFAAEIRAFKTQDSLKMPAKKLILFVGSSSFTKWTDVQEYFKHQTIINRGFGGSTLADVIYYANDVIFPYEPKQIVIYCGENDIASGKDIPADTVVNRFKRLYGMIREKMPKVSVLYVSMKPSPSRRHLFGQIVSANGQIRDFLEFEPNTYYVDVYNAMLMKDGQPNVSLFTSDSLHMNEKGYKLWKKILDPYVLPSK